MFTTLSVPVMTRLRQPERRVLDTLVDAGVARSRSDALAWCVRLVGENADAWLARLRDALRHVEQVRDQGPGQAPDKARELVQAIGLYQITDSINRRLSSGSRNVPDTRCRAAGAQLPTPPAAGNRAQ